MIYNFAAPSVQKWIFVAGLALAFAFTAVLQKVFFELLPKDAGREFAHDGKKSAGKPRGAGIIFVCVFVAMSLLFAPMNMEYALYLLLCLVMMITGYLDDAAKTPWGEYLKGALDLLVAVLVAVVFLMHHAPMVRLALFGISFSLPVIVYGIFAVILIWVSINVTNCADGVDGLSGTLVIVSALGIYGVLDCFGVATDFGKQIPILVMAVLAYLWLNATPSKLMMGDAGSRTLGLFLAIAVLQTGAPFLYLLLCFVLMMDGGLGLIKVSLIRFCKIHILKNTRTPLHDHVRKVWEWSNTQCVYRFAIIQILICVFVNYALR